MTLEVMILSPDMTPLGLISQMTALRWTQRVHTFGDFELWCPLNSANAELLKEENLVWIGTEEVAVIEGIQKTKDSEDSLGLQVSGRFNECWLERRVVWDRYSKTATPFTHMRNLVSANAVSPSISARKLPLVALMSESDPSSGSIALSAYGNNLWTALTDLGSAHGLFARLSNDVPSKVSKFSVRKGTNRSREQTTVHSVVLSSELSDILSFEYTSDSTSFTNAALVAGAGEGSARKTASVNPSISGVARRELYVDARDISDQEPWDYVTTTTIKILKYDDEDNTVKVKTTVTTVFTNRRTGETETESTSSIAWESETPEEGSTTESGVEQRPIPIDYYTSLLVSRGEAKLSENPKVEAFNSQVRMQGSRAYTYGEDYFLGDRITVEDKDLLIQVSTEVTEVEQVWDDESYSVSLTLGTSAPTITQLVKRRS